MRSSRYKEMQKKDEKDEMQEKDERNETDEKNEKGGRQQQYCKRSCNS